MMYCHTASLYCKTFMPLLEALFFIMDMGTGDTRIYFNPLQNFFISFSYLWVVYQSFFCFLWVVYVIETQGAHKWVFRKKFYFDFNVLKSSENVSVKCDYQFYIA